MTHADDIAIPVIVVGEYRFGIAGSRHRVEYEEWLDGVLSAASVLDVTEATTVYYAEIRSELRRAGTPIPDNDLWIAALCRQHRLPILSKDKHFDFVDRLTRINY